MQSLSCGTRTLTAWLRSRALAALARLLLDGVELAAELGGLVNLLDELVGLGGKLVEERLSLLLDARDEIGADLGRTELGLGLPLEGGLLHPDRDRAHDALAHVVAVELLLRVFVERLGEPFLERREVRAALGRVLAVHEGVVLLGEAVGVGEHELQRLRAEMERLVELLELRLVRDQILESLVRADAFAVQHQRQSGVEVGVHLEAAHHVILAELEVLEDRRVRQEAHEGTSTLVRILQLAAPLRLEDALLERRLGPFMPTENWKDSVSNLPPVFSSETQSTTLPSGMPRP